MASLTFTVEGSVSALITVTEVGGDLVFNVQLTSGTGTIGDLRALFFDVNNEALLDGLSATGVDVTDSAFQANTLQTLGGDANINGQVINQFGVFDAGVEFGTAGMSTNDVRSTQFILSHSTLDLTLDLINLMDFGVRITSVGTDGGTRTGSLKLGGEATAAPNAIDDTATANEDDAVSGNVLANDTDADSPSLTVSAVAGGSVGSAFAVTSAGGRIGQLLVDANGAFTFSPLGNFNALAVGESDTITVGYTASDGTGGSDTATLTITVTGTNDAPAITAVAGDSAGATLAETNAGLTATGTLTASDADVSDIITASVIGVTHSGPAGGLSDADLLGFFQVTSGALDTTTTTSGQLTWNFNSGSQAFDFLAVGETLTLHYTVRPDDGHGPSFVGDGVVTIHITGTSDGAPLFTEGNDTVNFNTLLAGTYQDGTQYNALGGNDLVFLPTNAAEAAEAGYVVGTAFIAGDGNNNIIGGSLDDTIIGGTGSDRMEGREGNDTLVGGAGNDQLIPGLGDDFIDGGAGADDAVTYNLGPVTVNLSTGTASGAEGNDTIVGVERVTGSNFADIIIGNDANNTLTGRGGNDTIDGGLGNDVIFGGLGDDALDGGGGLDRVSYQSATGSVTVDMSAGTATGADGNDTLMNIEQVFGSAFNDLFIGSSGRDEFRAAGGDDHLIGGDGNDGLEGDLEIHRTDVVGNDILEGGLGNDGLVGGFGNDTFVFRAGWGVDTVHDFGDGADVIDLRTMGFTDVSDLAIAQNGLNTEIDFGGGDMLILNNVNAALLVNSDFLFV